MEKLVNEITEKLVACEVVDRCDAEWFSYAVQKKLISLISGSAFLIIGVMSTELSTVAAYLGSFYFLRTRTNGYHAKTFILCLLYSLALELAMLYLLLPELNTFWVFALNAVCTVCVFLLAPVNDRSIHLNAAELKACKRSGRARMLLLDALLIAAYLLSVDSIVNGLTLGNTMTALLLVIARIKKENKDNEENDRVPQESR